MCPTSLRSPLRLLAASEFGHNTGTPSRMVVRHVARLISRDTMLETAPVRSRFPRPRAGCSTHPGATTTDLTSPLASTRRLRGLAPRRRLAQWGGDGSGPEPSGVENQGYGGSVWEQRTQHVVGAAAQRAPKNQQCAGPLVSPSPSIRVGWPERISRCLKARYG